MKKIFLLTLLILNLFANNYEVKLYNKIIPAIFKKNNIKIYCDIDSKKLLSKSTFFTIVDNCSLADIIIGRRFTKYDVNNLDAVCQKIPMFSTSYRAYKKYENSIGVFYWRKGRPQLKFDAKRIKKFNLILTDTLKRYTK